jgi:hypothetical protein
MARTHFAQHVVTALVLLVVAGCDGGRNSAPPAPAPAPVPSPANIEPPAPAPVSNPSDSEPIIITDPSQREAAVGKLVTVVGVQTRTKAPTVAGVDIDADDALADKRVRVTGILHKKVVEPRPPSAPIVASRGPGTYYHLVDPKTGTLAKPVLDE